MFGGEQKAKKKALQIARKGMYVMGDDVKRAFGAGYCGGSIENDVGNVLQYIPKVQLYNAINRSTGNHAPRLPKFLGGEKKPRAKTARGALVSKIMKEHGLSLGQASKYIKENGLM